MNVTDWQLMYGTLLMGRGTPYDVNWETIGLRDTPPIRATDVDRARGDGEWVGEEFAGGQSFPLSVLMSGRYRVDLSTAVGALTAGTTPRVPRDLWFKLPHMESPRCLVDVRVRRRALPTTRGLEHVARAELELRASNAARYGPEMTLRAEVGVKPAVIGVNEGDNDAWPRFYLSHPDGISGAIIIRNPETGRRLSIITTTAPGQVLAIDPSVGTAVVDYIDDRSTALIFREWWSIPPGSTFTVRVEGQPGLVCEVGWRSTWW